MLEGQMDRLSVGATTNGSAHGGASVVGNGTPGDDSDFFDITSAYREACASLSLGELVRKPEFALQDSIAALEIMDPKMDNGVIANVELEKQPLDLGTPRTPAEVLTIVDGLFAREMAWHAGAHLSQTLLTCVYAQALLQPDLISPGYATSASGEDLLDRVLFPLVAATVKCAFYVRNDFATGYLYEEEDVSSLDYGLSFLDRTRPEFIVNMLNDGATFLRQCLDTLDEGPSTDAATLEQLLLRLDMRRSILIAMANLGKPEVFVPACREAEKHAARITVDAKQTLVDDEQVFNTAFQRTLASTTPPRPMMSMPLAEAYATFRAMCNDLARLEMVDDHAAVTSPSAVLQFFDIYRRQTRHPLPLVRIRLQLLLLADKGPDDLAKRCDFCARSIQESIGVRDDVFGAAVAKVERPSDPRFKVREIATAQLSAIEGLLLDIYKVYCHNPGRQRRNLAKLLCDMDNLMADCVAADCELVKLLPDAFPRQRDSNAPPLLLISTWLRCQQLELTCTLLRQVTELELLKAHEWSAHYYHLDTALYLHTDLLYRIFSDLLAPTRAAKARNASAVATATVTLLRNEIESILCKAQLHVARALEFLGAIRQPSLVSSPAGKLGQGEKDDDDAHTDVERLYEHRLKIFRRCQRDPDTSPAYYFPDRAAFLADVGQFTGSLSHTPTATTTTAVNGHGGASADASQSQRAAQRSEVTTLAKRNFDAAIGLWDLARGKTAEFKVRARAAQQAARAARSSPVTKAAGKQQPANAADVSDVGTPLEQLLAADLEAVAKGYLGVCVSGKLSTSRLLKQLGTAADADAAGDDDATRWRGCTVDLDSRYSRHFPTVEVRWRAAT